MDAILAEIAKRNDRDSLNLGFTDASWVDKKWLLDILATLNEHHEYFQKGYKASKEEKVYNEDPELYNVKIDDPNGYFKNMPAVDPKKKIKGRNIFMTKEEKLQLKVKRMEAKANKAQEVYNKLMAKSG